MNIKKGSYESYWLFRIFTSMNNYEQHGSCVSSKFQLTSVTKSYWWGYCVLLSESLQGDRCWWKWLFQQLWISSSPQRLRWEMLLEA